MCRPFPCEEEEGEIDGDGDKLHRAGASASAESCDKDCQGDEQAVSLSTLTPPARESSDHVRASTMDMLSAGMPRANTSTKVLNYPALAARPNESTELLPSTRTSPQTVGNSGKAKLQWNVSASQLSDSQLPAAGHPKEDIVSMVNKTLPENNTDARDPTSMLLNERPPPPSPSPAPPRSLLLSAPALWSAPPAITASPTHVDAAITVSTTGLHRTGGPRGRHRPPMPTSPPAPELPPPKPPEFPSPLPAPPLVEALPFLPPPSPPPLPPSPLGTVSATKAALESTVLFGCTLLLGVKLYRWLQRYWQRKRLLLTAPAVQAMPRKKRIATDMEKCLVDNEDAGSRMGLMATHEGLESEDDNSELLFYTAQRRQREKERREHNQRGKHKNKGLDLTKKKIHEHKVDVKSTR